MTSAFFEEKGFFIFWRKNPFIGKQEWLEAEKYQKMVGKSCRLYLQPEWSRFDDIIPEIVAYIKRNSIWRMSLQVHKYMHIP